jgi:hypothetical protein
MTQSVRDLHTVATSNAVACFAPRGGGGSKFYRARYLCLGERILHSFDLRASIMANPLPTEG